MSREAIIAAVTTADAQGEKFHVEPCPRCKLAVKLPLDQLRHALPAGWTPAEAPTAAAAVEPVAPAVEASPAEAPTPPAAKEKSRHRRAAHKPE